MSELLSKVFQRHRQLLDDMSLIRVSMLRVAREELLLMAKFLGNESRYLDDKGLCLSLSKGTAIVLKTRGESPKTRSLQERSDGRGPWRLYQDPQALDLDWVLGDPPIYSFGSRSVVEILEWFKRERKNLKIETSDLEITESERRVARSLRREKDRLTKLYWETRWYQGWSWRVIRHVLFSEGRKILAKILAETLRLHPRDLTWIHKLEDVSSLECHFWKIKTSITIPSVHWADGRIRIRFSFEGRILKDEIVLPIESSPREVAEKLVETLHRIEVRETVDLFTREAS